MARCEASTPRKPSSIITGGLDAVGAFVETPVNVNTHKIAFEKRCIFPRVRATPSTATTQPHKEETKKNIEPCPPDMFSPRSSFLPPAYSFFEPR